MEGMGGRLSLIVEFADHDPIRLAGLAQLAPHPKQKAR
jgi:hypothetical protein